MTAGRQTQFSQAPLILKYLTSFAICFGNIGNAIVLGCIPVSRISLAYTYNTHEAHLSQVSSLFALTYLAGMIFVGFFYRRINRQKGAIIFLTIEAIAVALFPNLPSLIWFAVAAGVCGFCSAVYQTAQIAWVIDIWRHQCGPFIMAQYFFTAIGSIITPALLEPFLEDEEAEFDYDWSYWNSTPPERIEPSASPNFFVPFAITGVIVLLAALFQLVLYLNYRKQRFAVSLSEETSTTSDKPEEAKAERSETAEEKPTSRKKTIIILCLVFIAFYTTTQQMTRLFLSKFARYSSVMLWESDASRVLAAMQYTYAGGLAVGIFMIVKVAPQWLLLGNFTAAMLGNVLLVLLGQYHDSWFWVGTACLGIGFSTAVPALFAYAQKYLFINDKKVFIIMVSSEVLTGVYTLFIIRRQYMEESPNILIFCNIASIAVAIASFGILFRITYFRKNATS